jgi:hypothetical protein
MNNIPFYNKSHRKDFGTRVVVLVLLKATWMSGETGPVPKGREVGTNVNLCIDEIVKLMWNILKNIQQHVKLTVWRKNQHWLHWQ